MAKKYSISEAFDFLLACTNGIIDNTLKLYPCDRRLLKLVTMFEMHMGMQPKAVAEEFEALDSLHALREFFNCEDDIYWDVHGKMELDNIEHIYWSRIHPNSEIDVWDSNFWLLNEYHSYRALPPSAPVSNLVNIDHKNKEDWNIIRKAEEELHRLMAQPLIPTAVVNATACLRELVEKYSNRAVREEIDTIAYMFLECYHADIKCCQQMKTPTEVMTLLATLENKFPGSCSYFELHINELCCSTIPKIAQRLQDYIDAIVRDYDTVPAEYRNIRRNGFAENPRSFLAWELFEVIHSLLIKHGKEFKYEKNISTAVSRGKRGRKRLPYAVVERIASGIFIDRNPYLSDKNKSVKEFCDKYSCTMHQYDEILKKIKNGTIIQEGGKIIINEKKTKTAGLKIKTMKNK